MQSHMVPHGHFHPAHINCAMEFYDSGRPHVLIQSLNIARDYRDITRTNVVYIVTSLTVGYSSRITCTFEQQQQQQQQEQQQQQQQQQQQNGRHVVHEQRIEEIFFHYIRSF
ncbi:GATA zinc finger domain-containing protein 11-like [Vespa crabro]|uniref:GATA zinc finger domain-containing protein 11-like n=1 Tax=Vespa crabro TaxID=7445 RepID=UPI001EFF866D|nr:GATA zinc finger domain-containing protein 11-like [Vespa crabro]